MIEVRYNSECESEKQYVVDFVLGEFLGLSISTSVTADTEGIVIRRSNDVRELRLRATFFDYASKHWLSKRSLPDPAVNYIKTTDFFAPHSSLPEQIPTWDRSKETPFYRRGDQTNDLNVDLFGTIFLFLSRYEEAVTESRDKHDRLPANASLSGQANLLDRPIVNEYIELLWAAMTDIWPDLKRKLHIFSCRPSHDIDHPAKRWRRWPHVIKSTFTQLVQGRILAATRPVRNQLIYAKQSANQTWKNDPFDTICWIMDRAEQAGTKSAFYYIPLATDARYDRGMPLSHPHVVDQWKRIHRRGHEIGLHPSYNTYKHPDAFADSVRTLREQFAAAEIVQPVVGGRQHYLRWDPITTPQLWEQNGLDYDSTLGFADRAGFRCGICNEFPMYDLGDRKPMLLRQKPLIAMEASIISDAYMGLGMSDQGFDQFVKLKNQCRLYGGSFTLLWHNNLLVTDEQKSFYSAILED
jgi:hypothetical protein